ncbi:MAG: phenylpyruvate tautomerase MIF-related protein [Candidatus Pseudoruminococcus sp.]|mgnify:CR=1 FL=1|nr:phenylpyruvate tautomerase MIF-related protein [Ruminococcus sp.]MDY2783215.1 phenylpyruvate tautomerase MIF-related protein [Candidatus Pseudoruminococcus sp.]
MPFIELKASVSISKEKEIELKSAFGEAITIIPGKSEQWLMLNFCDEQRMWFKGSEKPCAMLEIKIYGSSSAKNYDNLTSKLTEIISDKLGISSDRIYVKYDEIEYWGYAGRNF